jgi:hypothetical protein
MRRFVLAALTVGALATPTTAEGQAARESCDPARPALLGVRAPAQVAIGRPAYAEEDQNYLEADWFLDRNTGRGFFTPASAGGQLTHAYTEPIDASPSSWLLRFAQGDSPALVGFAYEEYRYVVDGAQERCQRVVTARVEPIEGRLPRLSRTVSSRTGEVEISISKPLRSACIRAATGPVRVTFRGPGGARTVAINDQCGHLTKSGGSRRDWRLGGHRRYGTFYASFEDLFRRTGQRTFSYKARFAGKALASGRFIVKTKRTPGYRIYEGTDAFINVCINDLRTIWSSGGRLYCDEPAHLRTRIRFLQRGDRR